MMDARLCVVRLGAVACLVLGAVPPVRAWATGLARPAVSHTTPSAVPKQERLSQTRVARGQAALPTGYVSPEVASGRATKMGPHDPAARLRLNLGLPLRHQATLSALIVDEARRRRFMSHKDFDTTYGPTRAQVTAVSRWAAKQGLAVLEISPDNLLITVSGTTSAIEAAFHVVIDDYRLETGFSFYSLDRDPAFPTDLGIQSVTGLESYSRLRAAHLDRMSAAARPRAGRQAQGAAARLRYPSLSGYTPADLRSIYNTQGLRDAQGHPYDGTGQTIGLTLWGQAVPDSDLKGFAAATGDVPMSAGTGPDQVEWIGVNGNNPASGTTEAITETAMDVEYAHGMAPRSHLKFFLGDSSAVGMEQAISAAANDAALHIVSNSWGKLGEIVATDPFVLATTNSFMHATAVGTTFYFSSGDKGSHSTCSSDARPPCGDTAPLYPAANPYVVAVGGTRLSDDALGHYVSETAWSCNSVASCVSSDLATGGSGGGCSDDVPRPSWQTGIGAATCRGRAIPDIAADGDNDSGAYVYHEGRHDVVGGTSLAAPLVAGMAAATNRYLEQNGRPLMGFAAPIIYAMATSPNYQLFFHDVISGTNGFPAGPGWDQVTGWGSQDWVLYTEGWACVPFCASAPTRPVLPSTTWTGQAGGTAAPLAAVACPTMATCVAAGGAAAPPHLRGPSLPGLSVNAGTIVATGNGGSTTWRPATGAGSQPLHGVACAQARVCHAVGDAGTLLKTVDGGVTWSAQSSGTPRDLRGIACPDTQTCYAVGSAGTLLKTVDGGVTWSAQSSGTPRDLRGIACPDTQTCYAVGSAGTLLKTVDGGVTWSAQSSGTPRDLRGIACPDTQTCFTVGEHGTIQRTITGGQSGWTAEASPAADTLTAIACSDVTVCFAVGAGGVLLATATAGDPRPTWESQNTGVTTDLWGLTCPDESACYAVGDHGLVLATTPGVTWQSQTMALTNHGTSGQALEAVTCPYEHTCYAVGDGGTLLKTVDGGATWDAQSSGTSTALFGIACPGDSVCYTVGGAGTLLKTVDGGATWSAQSSGTSATLFGIACPSTQTCYAVGGGGTVVKTSTGGDDWHARASATLHDLHAIACRDASTCTAVGSQGAIERTSDGGASGWTTSRSGTFYDLWGVACPDTRTCYAVGQKGTILAARNGGDTWTGQDSGTTRNLYGVTCTAAVRTCYVAEQRGTRYDSGRAGALLATRDGGTAWRPQGSDGPPPALVRGVACPGVLRCYAVGAFGAILSTQSGGFPWTPLASHTPQNLNAITCRDTLTCYAVGVNGTAVSLIASPLTLTLRTGGVDGTDQPLTAVACVDTPLGSSAPTCYATSWVGGERVGLLSTQTGDRWSPRAMGDSSLGYSYGLACPDAQTCYMVGYEIGTWSGTGDQYTWSAQTIINAQNRIEPLYGAACPPVAAGIVRLATRPPCYVVGQEGTILTRGEGTAWIQQTSGVTETLRGVACPEDRTCYAVGEGGVILATSDGGRRWSRQTSPTTADLLGIGCPTPTTCYAVGRGGAILATSNAGLTWAAQDSGVRDLSGVACPIPTTCYAVGLGGTLLTMATQLADHPGWSVAQAPQATPTPPTALVLPTPRLLPTAEPTAAPISRWVRQSGGGVGPLYGVACADGYRCAAVGVNGIGGLIGSGAQIQTTGDGGGSWSGQSNPVSDASQLFGVTCRTLSLAGTPSCVAVGQASSFTGAILATTPAGSWTAQGSSPSVLLYGVACPSVCYAVGARGTVLKSAAAGGWSPQPNPLSRMGFFSSPALHGIACATDTECYAVGERGSILATVDGSSWITETTPLSGGPIALQGVSCPTPRVCYAVGDKGMILVTTDGQTWTQLSNPLSSTVETLTGVACPTRMACYAVGNRGSILATIDGSSWTAQPSPLSSTGEGLSSVACPQAETCYAVSLNGTILRTVAPDGLLVVPSPLPELRASGWSRRISGVNATLLAAACASPSTCYAVGASGILLATADGGATWTDQSSRGGPRPVLSSVACAPAAGGAPSACVAVGPAGTIQTLTSSGGWTSASRGAPADRDLYGVTCPAAGTCLAAGQAGTLLLTTTSGGAWVTQDSHTSRDLYGLACASPLLCVAVGENGALLRGSADPAHPAAWTWTTLAVPTAVTLWSVSCTRAACAAVGGGGTLLVTTDLATWQSAASGTSNPLYAVSCADGGASCVATGFRGTIVGGPLPSTAPWTLQISGTVQGLNGVTCAPLPVTSPCLAVGDSGTLLALTGP